MVIHDSEGTLQDVLKTFQTTTSQVGIHSIVDTDGKVYQLIHDQDITYHAGNFLYNDQSIGIEHVGFDATGYTSYNAAQYLGSAKLVAYLLNKYHIPLDHDHIVSHGTVPATFLKTTPNHVDPGPYWLWDYLIGYVCNASGSTAPNCQVPNCDASHDKAVFVSTLHFTADQLQPNPTEVQDGGVQKNIPTTTDWYAINFNHRQAWVPSTAVSVGI